MILTNTGMLFFLLKWPNFSLRVASSLKFDFGSWSCCRMSGVRLEYSRVVVGSIMLFIVLNHTSCYSGGLLTISSSRRIRLSKLCLPSN
ncbi:uncharacterized protein [Gossypium hirsutum]|uniref:Uncharacterized protein isoform X2 n=1 Tax=Gossypium hirsutum TaxID=3635 RepID=A0ABM3AF83_GOSHI|nr:uncharacterized protein LOC107954178 isoform X2 [Gossypium hirsutum]